MVLVLVPGIADRVWTVAEVCSDCAHAIPRSTVFEGSSAPVVSPLPQQVSSMSRAQRAAWTEPCRVCAQEALEAHRAAGDTARVVSQLITDAAGVEALMRHLGDADAGRSASARLLALTLVLRSGPCGTSWLAADDLSPHRTGLSEADLLELSAEGLLRSPTSAPTCQAPVMACALAAHLLEPTLALPEHARRSLHDWVWRVAGHPLLRGLSADARLAAVYLTAGGRRGHVGHVRLRMLARHCCCPGLGDGALALRALQEAGWLRTLHLNSGRKQPVTYQLADQVQPLVPRAAPERFHHADVTIDVARQERAMAARVHAYYRRHGHPPVLREVLTARCGQNADVPRGSVQLTTVADVLRCSGWLDIDSAAEPLVRPGPRYWKRVSAPARRKRHALSPRIEDRPLPPARPLGGRPRPQAGRRRLRNLLIRYTPGAIGSGQFPSSRRWQRGSGSSPALTSSCHRNRARARPAGGRCRARSEHRGQGGAVGAG